MTTGYHIGQHRYRTFLSLEMFYWTVLTRFFSEKMRPFSFFLAFKHLIYSYCLVIVVKTSHTIIVAFTVYSQLKESASHILPLSVIVPVAFN